MTLPRTLGKYRVLGPLGRGGHGAVYRSEDPSTGGSLAIKTTLGASWEERAALEREIAALARLTAKKRRGVIQLLDAGVEDGRPWYAMPLVAGESLRLYQRDLWADLTLPDAALSPTGTPTLASGAVVAAAELFSSREPAGARGPTHAAPRRAAAGRLQEVLKLVLNLAECLQGIHEDGIVHGDVSPSNVLRAANGEPLLVDFGTAFYLHQGDLLREVAQPTGRRIGTPGFMAPEQIRGHGVEPRSDLYALGCLLYELLTGETPLRGEEPRALLRQHLSVTPRRASELVADLPPDLDALVTDLLEKRPHRRPSRAEDVVARLAALLGLAPAARPRELREAVSLYRPQLTGRTELLRSLIEPLQREPGAGGECLALAGPSGSGKTRLLNELSAHASQLGWEVVTVGGTSPGGASGEPNPVPVAFAAALPQLAVLAHAAGPVDEALVAALTTLAPYAADGLSGWALPPRRNLASRADVLASLETLVRACCRGARTVLVLDDLQWADELTLSFVRERVPSLATADAFVVCGYRTEEIGEKLESIGAAAARTLELSPLELPHVYAITRDMLATEAAPEGLPEYLLQHSEGSPFLVAEYLRAAVLRGQVAPYGAGQLVFIPPPAHEAALPASLQVSFALRVARLSENARGVLELVAVLGGEFDAARVSVLAEGLLATEALEELVREQMLDHAANGRYRFVNDKLREAQTLALAAERRRELHRLAATSLESDPGRDAPNVERDARLGRHWQEAGEPARALGYLLRAADASQALHAHAHAATLYRMALAQHEKLTGAAPLPSATRAELLERLGDALLAQASHADARAAFEDALRLEPSARPLDQARIFRKLGSSYWRQHAHDHARQQLTLAEATLGSPLADAPPGVFGEHIEIQLGKFEQLYFSQEETAVAHALLAALEATIDQHGSPGQRARYYLCAASNTMAKARFAYSEAALAYARKGAAVVVDQLTLREEALAQFIVGFALMLGERPAREEALQWFDRAANGAARSGDRTLGSRVATYRALTHLRQGEVAEARDAAENALELAEAAKIAIYAAAAHACAAWVHWRTPGDDRALVLGRAEEAQRRWHDKPASFPFRWCLNFVLLDLAQQEQRCAALLGPLEQLLEPLQQVLPEALESSLRRALSACREDRLAEATVATDEALRLARRGGFC